MSGAEQASTDTGEVAVPPDAFVTIDIDQVVTPDSNKSAGHQLEDALQHKFAGHKLMGSDGLAEIVTLQLTRSEAFKFEVGLANQIAKTASARREGLATAW